MNNNSNYYNKKKSVIALFLSLLLLVNIFSPSIIVAQTVTPSPQPTLTEEQRRLAEEAGRSAGNAAAAAAKKALLDHLKNSLRKIFGGATEGEGPADPGDGGTPVETVRLNFSAWGLPEPKAETSGGVRGYTQLLNQLKSNQYATWGATELLAGERYAKANGYPNLIRYLTTGWIWFENGSAKWPDVYQTNCDDPPPNSESPIMERCLTANFQTAGYRPAEQVSHFREAYTKLYKDESKMKGIMDAVISNSNKASSTIWQYRDVSIPSDIKLTNIAADRGFFLSNPQIQQQTLILGRDPKMAAAMNSYAVSEGDVVRALKSSGCGYGYICATQRQVLSNIIAALYIFENGSLTPPTNGGGNPPPRDDGGPTVGCDPSSTQITIPGTQKGRLNRKDHCMKPTMLVIHYTVGWISAEGTLDVLNDRGLSCHLATDKNKQLQALSFYSNKVERSACTLGYNESSISNEISGDSFDQIYNNPNHSRYNELKASTNKALDSSCWMMKQYNIPISQVYGHFELTPGKSDPGPKYLAYFKSELAKKRNNNCQ